MKKILFLFLPILIISCSQENTIYYNFGNVTITRINDYPKDYFFYGKRESLKDTLTATYIKTSFSGFNSGMRGFVIFNDDETVSFIRMDASFEKIGNEKSLNIVEFENNLEFINWEDDAKQKFQNKIYISDVIELEKKRNKEYKSEVKSVYPE